MISKCTTGCPMVTPFVPSVRCPQGTGLTVVTNPPPRTHRRRLAAFPRKRPARHAPNGPDCTELHSFARGGMLTRDVTSTCQPEGTVRDDGRPGARRRERVGRHQRAAYRAGVRLLA